jgi:hypothetical protein
VKGKKKQLMSMAAREILIKYVAEGIRTYAMACFDISKSLCDDISKTVCQYWWS